MSLEVPRENELGSGRKKGYGRDTLLAALLKRRSFGVTSSRVVVGWLRSRVVRSLLCELVDTRGISRRTRSFVALCVAKLALDQSDHFDKTRSKKIRVVVNGAFTESMCVIA